MNALFRGLSISAILIAGTTSTPLDAQDSTSSGAFDVASIKTRTGDRVAGGTTTPDRFARAESTLRDLRRLLRDRFA